MGASLASWLVWSNLQLQTQLAKLLRPKFDTSSLATIKQLPVASASAEQTAPLISAQAAMVIDISSGAVLYKNNPDVELHPASTSKLLTALVARQIYNLDEVLEIKEETFTEGTKVDFEIGEQITVHDALKGLLINSGNDVAFLLANNHPLDYQAFVAEMNQLAQELGLQNSHFANPSGLDHSQQVLSARDLSILARQVLKDEVLSEIVKTKSDQVADLRTGRIHYLRNTNYLLHSLPGVIGMKTGTTPQAGEALVMVYQSDQAQILFIVLGSQDRYTDVNLLLNWALTQYSWLEVEAENPLSPQVINLLD